MFLNIILILIIIVGLAGILSIASKKIPQLKRVDPENIPESRQTQTKKDILEKRFKNDIDLFKKKIIVFGKPIFSTIYKYLKNIYQKIYKLEEKYKSKLIRTQFENKISQEDKTNKYLEKAKKFENNKEWSSAENEYIQALKLDMYNFDIYKKLGNLYFQSRDYKKAKETYEYIIKTENDDTIYNKLGEISTKRGDLKQALLNYNKSIEIKNNNPIYHYNLADINLRLDKLEESLKNIKRALNIEPQNPKLLDFLMDLSIIMGDKDLAKKTLNKLIQVNPNNQKISEIRQKISNI